MTTDALAELVACLDFDDAPGEMTPVQEAQRDDRWTKAWAAARAALAQKPAITMSGAANTCKVGTQIDTTSGIRSRHVDQSGQPGPLTAPADDLVQRLQSRDCHYNDKWCDEAAATIASQKALLTAADTTIAALQAEVCLALDKAAMECGNHGRYWQQLADTMESRNARETCLAKEEASNECAARVRALALDLSTGTD